MLVLEVWKKLVILIVFMLLHLAETQSPSKQHPGFPNIVEAVFGKTYEENSTRNHGFLFEYSYNHTYNSAVYITTGLINKEKNYSNDFPTQVVVRQELAIQSWDLPLLMQSGVEFSQVSRKLCAIGQNINTTLPISIEVTTFSERLIEFSIHAEIQVNLTVSIGTDYTIFVTPTSPQYYQFTFPKNSTQAVTLYVNSSQNYYCSRVAIQSAECPIQDLTGSVETGVTFQTFLQKAALIINNNRVSKAVYIVFTVMPNDQLCSSQERIIPIGDPKVKEMEFWIEDHIEETVYIFALLAAVGYCSAYCLAAVFYLLIIKLWERRRKSQEIEMNSPVPTVSNGNTEASASAGNPSINDINHDDSLLLDADTLADQDEIKDVYRLKKNLMVADMARKPSTHLRKKYMLYVRNLISISIFYALPVIQLVLAYQKYLNLSGNEDTCYYNFLCSRHLGGLHSFNSVISNIGYMVLGILFIIITHFRFRDSMSKPEEERERLGIPQHVGIFYAMGLALFVEGIMSGCYHVCPSYNNFQFDTAFMYILGGLLTLRLFQSRHPDINANAHTAFISLAIIIIIAVVGVLFNSPVFWYVFTFFYLLSVIYLSIKIYYVGRFKFDKALMQSIKHHIVSVRSDKKKCSAPTYPVKFGFLLFMNACNWGMGLYGVITKPADFATFMLEITIMNLALYFMFYIAMKRIVHKERLVPQTYIFGLLSIALWVPALWYFINNLTDWQKTPAQSRNLNAPCIVLDFFDGHDIWHFLSAGAMFCSFLAILFIDDDLKDTPRTEIPVF